MRRETRPQADNRYRRQQLHELADRLLDLADKPNWFGEVVIRLPGEQGRFSKPRGSILTTAVVDD